MGLLWFSASAQNGYLRTDSTYLQGTIVDQGVYKNNRELVFKDGNKIVTYTPEQVFEYGFMKGDVYVRRSIREGNQSKSYFFLRLVNGDRNLYQLKDDRDAMRFFIEHDSSLVEITSAAFRDQLATQLKPCGSSQNILKLVRFSRRSLKRAAILNNKCFKGLFPSTRVGGMLGYESNEFSLSNTVIVDHLYFQTTTTTPITGVFIDTPAGMIPSLFLNIGITYQQNSYGGSHIIGDQNQDYQFNFSTIGIPILFKYKINSTKFRPFVSIGPRPAFNLQQTNKWIMETATGPIVKIQEGIFNPVKAFQISAALNSGIEFSLSHKTAISVEARYSTVFDWVDTQGGSNQAFSFIGSFYF